MLQSISSSLPLSPLFFTPDSPDAPSVSSVLPGQFSTVGRPASCIPQQRKEETEVDHKGEVREVGRSTLRRIRAPRGAGMSSLMASLTSSPPANSCHDHSTSCCTYSSEVHSLPRLATTSSLNSEASCNSISYRTLSASSSCSQVSLGEIIVTISSVIKTISKYSSPLLFLPIFFSTHRICRGSPATSSPCCPLTVLPESSHSLLPPPPPLLLVLPSHSPPPSPAPQAMPCNLSSLTPVISL